MASGGCLTLVKDPIFLQLGVCKWWGHPTWERLGGRGLALGHLALPTSSPRTQSHHLSLAEAHPPLEVGTRPGATLYAAGASLPACRQVLPHPGDALQGARCRGMEP